MSLEIDNIETLIKNIQQPTLLQQNNGNEILVLPEGIREVDIERFYTYPKRKRATATLTDADSFSTYTNTHKETRYTRIYGDAKFEAQQVSLLAIIDDHADGEDNIEGCANWRQHRAIYAPVKSFEWKTWNEADGKQMTQLDFATFIEDNIKDITNLDADGKEDKTLPSGADMLKMALAFEANSEKSFKSRTNTQSGGVDMVFVDRQNNETESKMSMFKRFRLGLQPFLRGTGFPIEVRLKYKVAGGAVTFWFELVRPDLAFQLAVETEFKKIEESTNLKILYGSTADVK